MTRLIDMVEKIVGLFDESNLPEDLTVSTMTITCKLRTCIDLPLLYKYTVLSDDCIVCIKYGNRARICSRGELTGKILKKLSKKKTVRWFFNQVTIIIRPDKKYNNGNPNKVLNVKLFRNGSVQMTGCNLIQQCPNVLGKIFSRIKKPVHTYNFTTRKIDTKIFVTDPLKTSVQELHAVKIQMINSNFRIEFKIDREKLYDMLQLKKIECLFEPMSHPCVNVKYYHKKAKKISIFVFESGSIIITGANCLEHILSAYVFINKFLLENYRQISYYGGESDV